MSDIAKKIKHYRTINGYTQKEFAEKIGVSNVVMSRYESGTRNPDNDTQIKIADIFNITLDELNGRTPKESSDDYEAFMFEDKEAFDSLPEEVKKDLIREINEKIEFLKYKQEKEKKGE